MYHSSNSPYGENLYWTSLTPDRINGGVAVKSWYDEIRLYRYDGKFTGTTGHFTQVVWKGCTEIGVAVAGNSRNGTYVVVVYNPPGNVIGHFMENVPRPVGTYG